ncbi:MAG: hypothetical protein H5T70_08255 [Chloroflexi bacterium]|nr:hypothetical protein [Chloroflexota bacterium]MBC7316394.1 hypothetical protein [Chloroflexota bacterium]
MKGAFFVALTLLGAVVALAIHQVGQPWRGVLVAWLLASVGLGNLIVRALKHYLDYRASAPREAHRAPKRYTPYRGFEGLRVTYSDAAGKGRHIIR